MPRLRHNRKIHKDPPMEPLNPRATNLEIQKWVAKHHGFVPETAWIAHVKHLCGLAGPGDQSPDNPCPPEKIPILKQAFRKFGLLTSEPHS